MDPTIRNAAAAVVLLIALSGFIALILGAWLKSRQPPAERDADEYRPLPLRAAGSRPDALPLHQPFRETCLREVRGDHASGMGSHGATVLSLPLRTRLDRAAQRQAESRRVSPFGIDGGAA
jgi:hypothetical protein